MFLSLMQDQFAVMESTRP